MKSREVMIDEDVSWFRRRPTIAEDLTPQYILKTIDKKVILKIFYYLISAQGFDSEQYFYLKSVCKRFHEIVTSMEYWSAIPMQLPDGRLNFCSFQWKTTKNEGTEGTCYRVKYLQTGEDCAFKRSKLFPSICNDHQQGISYYLVREIAVLKTLSHPNIVSMKAIHLRHGCLHTLFPYYHHTLGEIIKRNEPEITNKQALNLMQQVLSGLKYCHARGILHRNLKPKHLVLEFKNGSTSLDDAIVRIADFALVRMTSLPSEPLTNEVVSLWYRSPELLLGEREYGGAVDIWSVGCIYAEMLLGRSLFPGNNQIDQLCQIFSHLGTPTTSFTNPASSQSASTSSPSAINSLEWNDILSLPHYHRTSFPKFVAKSWKEIVPRISSIDEKILQASVVCNPKHRYNAEGLLNLISAELEFFETSNWAKYSKRLFGKGNKQSKLCAQQSQFFLHKEIQYMHDQHIFSQQLSSQQLSSATSLYQLPCEKILLLENGKGKEAVFAQYSQRFWAIEWILSVVYHSLNNEYIVTHNELSLRTGMAAISLMDTFCAMKQMTDYWHEDIPSCTNSPNAASKEEDRNNHEMEVDANMTLVGNMSYASPIKLSKPLDQHLLLTTAGVQSPDATNSLPLSTNISPQAVNKCTVPPAVKHVQTSSASREKKMYTNLMSHEVNAYLSTKYLMVAMACVHVASKIEDVHVISIRELIRLSDSRPNNQKNPSKEEVVEQDDAIDMNAAEADNSIEDSEGNEEEEEEESEESEVEPAVKRRRVSVQQKQLQSKRYQHRPQHCIETIDLFMLEEEIIKTVDYGLFIPTVKDFVGVNLYQLQSILPASLSSLTTATTDNNNNNLTECFHVYYKLPMLLLSTLLSSCPSNNTNNSDSSGYAYYPASLLSIALIVLIESDTLYHVISTHLMRSSSSHSLPSFHSSDQIVIMSKQEILTAMREKIRLCYCSTSTNEEEGQLTCYHNVEEYCTALAITEEVLYACYVELLHTFQVLLQYHQQVGCSIATGSAGSSDEEDTNQHNTNNTAISCLLRHFVQGYVPLCGTSSSSSSGGNSPSSSSSSSHLNQGQGAIEARRRVMNVLAMARQSEKLTLSSGMRVGGIRLMRSSFSRK